MNLLTAQSIAEEIVATLSPACLRIEIKGSVCRQKADGITDIEIVCIPQPQPRLVFGQKPGLSPLHDLVDELRAREICVPRFTNGRSAWGPKERRALWNTAALDLFITTPECWGVIATLRTGDADFSRLLVTPCAKWGALPDDMAFKGGRLWRNNMELNTPEESDIFRELDLPWVEPHQRSKRTLQALILSRSAEKAKV
jgi:DNA polymerase/3'-5' exonuclease PolX